MYARIRQIAKHVTRRCLVTESAIRSSGRVDPSDTLLINEAVSHVSERKRVDKLPFDSRPYSGRISWNVVEGAYAGENIRVS